MLKNQTQVAEEDGLNLALQVMAYIAQDDEKFERMATLTGIAMGDVRDRIHDPHFQAMILDHALEDQSLTLAFCASKDLAPDALLRARRKLPGATY